MLRIAGDADCHAALRLAMTFLFHPLCCLPHAYAQGSLLGIMGNYAMVRYRKVTTWARLQTAPGPKVVAVRPLVMPFSTAHSMG